MKKLKNLKKICIDHSTNIMVVAGLSLIVTMYFGAVVTYGDPVILTDLEWTVQFIGWYFRIFSTLMGCYVIANVCIYFGWMLLIGVYYAWAGARAIKNRKRK